MTPSTPKGTDPAEEFTVASSEPSLRFTPLAEGDITIISSDGVKFLVHSHTLKRSSSVFADMFSVATRDEQAIELDDDAESIALMLGFLYPFKPLSIHNFSILEKALIIAQKYDVEGIPKALDDTIPAGAHADFIRIDPLRMLRLGTAYGLRNTSTLASKAVQRQYRHFEDSEAINGFVGQFSDTASLMRVVGTMGARAKILHDVLYDFQNGLPPLDPDEVYDPGYDHWTDLLCTRCCKDQKYNCPDRFAMRAYCPHWLFDWAKLAFSELIGKDVADCDFLFTASVFNRITPNSNYPFCIHELIDHHQSRFNIWAGNVKAKLQDELSKLESGCVF
ncbi:hypothetical protein FRC12_007788 [Ceratobasidium sp. 428]|nr:hypothetical protein FRC12_007788 [Ceratobasidium sp. 428]